MASEEEKRFALGFLALLVLLIVAFVVVNLLDLGGSEDEADTEQLPPVVSSEPAVTNTAIGSSAPSRSSTESASADGNAGSASADGDVPTEDEAEEEASAQPAVIDVVPLVYFADDTNPAELPAVIEKYIDRVDRGTRFMARLESIATNAAEIAVAAAESPDVAISIKRLENAKRISFNVKRVTTWLEANFTHNVPLQSSDVLVDARRVQQDNQMGPRLDLFFASVQPQSGGVGFTLEDISDSDEIELFVYDATDALPLIGRTRLQVAD